jgi:hypothetical protein
MSLDEARAQAAALAGMDAEPMAGSHVRIYEQITANERLPRALRLCCVCILAVTNTPL